jgi:DUF1680 family protein
MEEADNGSNLSAISLNRNLALKASHAQGPAGDMIIVEGDAERIDENGWDRKLYRPFEYNAKTVHMQAVPYFTWGNKTKGEMMTWIRYK